MLARWITREGRIQSLWVDAPTEAEARTLAQDLQALLPEARVAHFPGFAPYAGGESSPPGMVLRDRLATLVGLLERRVQVLVTGPLAAFEKLPHPTWFQKQKLDLRQGAEVPRELLLETLIALGYRRTEMASEPGEFSSRGMVVDLWPDHLGQPLRLETFGDELERLSPFDPDTQRRTGEALESLTLYPRFEGERGDGQALLDAVASRADRTPEPEDDLAFRRSRLATHGHFPGEELFHPLLAQPKGQLVHWVAPCLRVRLEGAWEEALREAERARIDEGLAALRRGGVVCPDFEDRFLATDPSRATFHLTEWQSEATVPLAALPLREFQGRLPDLATHVQELALTGHRVFLAGSTPGMKGRFAEFLRDYDLPQAYGTETGCRAIQLSLSAGVHLKEPALVVFTEREIFGRKAVQAAPKKSRSAAFLSDLRDLKPGDRVVHLDHGIGEFVGFATLTVGGEEQEVLQLRYADGGQLNVSLERADLVQRYTGAEGHLPPLDKLGGASWAKVKRKAKKAMRDMADELLKLYAQRKLEKGHAFRRRALAGGVRNSFAFDAHARPDRAPSRREGRHGIAAPMDRLLWVTWVSARRKWPCARRPRRPWKAARWPFCAPTTVLCFQHFRTFKERFAGFPSASRCSAASSIRRSRSASSRMWRTAKWRSSSARTRCWAPGVKFADLGLVVDRRGAALRRGATRSAEAAAPQRGRRSTLSATPIPRTLHMCLHGHSATSASSRRRPRTAWPSRPWWRPGATSWCRPPSSSSCAAAARSTWCTTAWNPSSPSPRGCSELVPEARRWSWATAR